MTIATTPHAPPDTAHPDTAHHDTAHHDTAPGPLASRVVPSAELPWQATRLPGVHVKTLLIDRATGLATSLMKLDPGAILPDHEHVLIEQTFVLEGTLVDRDGPEACLEVGPGGFVWRPAGSRHSAWSPGGCVTLAMFQIPNRFFEADGSIVDLLGRDWGEAWSHALPPQG